jgi:alpha-tubulin suppressor-like RCC1 family protein
MSMRFKGGVISATAPTITAPVDGEGGTASGMWTLETQLQNAGSWPKPVLLKELWAWGSSSYGKLGLNNTANRSSPAQVGSQTDWSEVSSRYTSFAIKADNTLWCLGGENLSGQAGLGNTIFNSSPVQVGALSNWAKIGLLAAATQAIKTDGTLWAWGLNSSGQLGDDSTVSKSSPIQVGALTTWSKVYGTGISSIAIKTDGTLWTWGSNDSGRLGLNLYFSGQNRSSPVQVGALTNWLQAKGGAGHVVALKTDGTIWSWGKNQYGQLGQNNTVYRSSPVQIGTSNDWSQISAGNNWCLASKTNGTMWAWGRGTEFQLSQGGYGTNINHSSPVQIGALTTWSKISAGQNVGFAISTAGSLWTWGGPAAGATGQNNGNNIYSPTQVGALTTWIRLGNMPSITAFAIKTP